MRPRFPKAVDWLLLAFVLLCAFVLWCGPAGCSSVVAPLPDACFPVEIESGVCGPEETEAECDAPIGASVAPCARRGATFCCPL